MGCCEGTAASPSSEQKHESEGLDSGAPSIGCGVGGTAAGLSPENELEGKQLGGGTSSLGWLDEGHVCGVWPVGCRA